MKLYWVVFKSQYILWHAYNLEELLLVMGRKKNELFMRCPSVCMLVYRFFHYWDTSPRTSSWLQLMTLREATLPCSSVHRSDQNRNSTHYWKFNMTTGEGGMSFLQISHRGSATEILVESELCCLSNKVFFLLLGINTSNEYIWVSTHSFVY